MGGGRGTASVPLIFFSSLLELIRHSDILLSKSNIKALRSMVFDKVRSLFDITQIQRHFPGYEVSLESALTWIIRELRLHGVHKEIIDLSLKLDGRPFAGENTIFSKYSIPYFHIPLLYFATTVLHLRKKNIETI